MPQDDEVTVSEIVEELEEEGRGVTPKTVYNWIKDGLLGDVRRVPFGRRRDQRQFIKRAAWEAFKATLPASSAHE